MLVKCPEATRQNGNAWSSFIRSFVSFLLSFFASQGFRDDSLHILSSCFCAIEYGRQCIICLYQINIPRLFKNSINSCSVHFQNRVATDLENLEKSGNLKETSESQGICLKSQGICNRIPKVREFCCLKFIFSQVEDPNFGHYLGEHVLRLPLNGLGKVREFHLV